jgi:thymidylate synthase (FAD)
MIKSSHGAALEHGTVYLFYSVSCYDREGQKWVSKYESNPYSKVVYVGVDDDDPAKDGNYYNLIGNEACGNEQYVITANYRILVENNWLDDLQYLCSPTEFHEKRYTMRFTCSRAIAQELTRHRKFSFLMESQRYINYSKERHGGEITYIKPSWLNVPTGIVYWHDGICWRVQQDENNPMEWFSVIPQEGFSEKDAQVASTYFDALSHAEKKYFFLLKKKCQAQQARDVLPNATKTELVMTGFSSDWRHVLDLRLFEKTGAVHPDMLDLMLKAQEAMIEAGIWKDIMSKQSKF